MRWLLFAFPMLLGAADLKIDHVTVAGRDLKKMTADLQAAGIPMVYGGPHANGVTEMSLCSFPDGSYLEAIAPIPSADPARIDRNEWGPFLTRDAAACAWAARSVDLAADRRRLAAAGVATSAVEKGGRARPDGVRVEWETLTIGEATRGSFFPFLIRDVTPRERRAFPQGKPVTTDYRGVAWVVIAVRDLDRAAEQYRKAFGFPAPARQNDPEFGAKLAAAPGWPLILAEPLTRGGWLERRLQQTGEGPCAFVLEAARSGGSGSRWFGKPIRWVAPDKLGWRLGVGNF
jgi:catechol 2,3-dioxygenase-like lactoylglutathione lyase family enzyme